VIVVVMVIVVAALVVVVLVVVVVATVAVVVVAAEVQLRVHSPTARIVCTQKTTDMSYSSSLKHQYVCSRVIQSEGRKKTVIIIIIKPSFTYLCNLYIRSNR